MEEVKLRLNYPVRVYDRYVTELEVAKLLFQVTRYVTIQERARKAY